MDGRRQVSGILLLGLALQLLRNLLLRHHWDGSGKARLLLWDETTALGFCGSAIAGSWKQFCCNPSGGLVSSCSPTVGMTSLFLIATSFKPSGFPFISEDFGRFLRSGCEWSREKKAAIWNMSIIVQQDLEAPTLISTTTRKLCNFYWLRCICFWTVDLNVWFF